MFIQLGRVFPLELLLMTICLMSVFVWGRFLNRERMQRAARSRALAIALALACFFGFAINFARLWVGIGSNPTVMSVLTAAKGRAECVSLFGSGPRIYNADSFDHEKEKVPDFRIDNPEFERLQCFALLSDPVLDAPDVQARLRTGLAHYLGVRPIDVITQFPSISINGVRASRVFDIVRLDSDAGFDTVTPFSCYPNPRPEVPIRGFAYVPGASELKSVDLRTTLGGESIKRIKLLIDSQYLCYGLAVKVNGMTTRFLFQAGKIISI